MMHVFRLLDMAKEIGLKGALHVRQSDPAQLLRIKNGEYGYDELLGQAEGLQQEIEEIYQSCPLPEKPDIAKVNRLLVDIRKSFYHTSEARK
jgi:hypothetical protein